MKSLDLTLPMPAENLACDEALLDMCEGTRGSDASSHSQIKPVSPRETSGARAGERGSLVNLKTSVSSPQPSPPLHGSEEEDFSSGILRFWESPEYFVVVGYGNKVAEEVNQAACAKMNVPILRRCSGGGTVVQGPGCLNYALILPFDEIGPLRTITAANRFIMERNRAAIEAILQNAQSPSPFTLSPPSGERDGVRGAQFKVEVCGHTDLALRTPHSAFRIPLKFSGNAQRRKKHFLLFHGTFLLHFDLALIEKLLLMPSKQPDYRQHRAHSEFLTNLNVSTDAVKQSLQTAWNVNTRLAEIPHNKIADLVREKYSTAEWNLKF